MLLLARVRRSRPTLLFACLLVLTAIVYALLNVLTQTPDSQHQAQRRVALDDRPSTVVVVGNVSSPRPAPLRLVRRSVVVRETTESSAESPSSSGGDNATVDDDGRADTGTERAGTVTRQQDAERRVRREVPANDCISSNSSRERGFLPNNFCIFTSQ